LFGLSTKVSNSYTPGDVRGQTTHHPRRAKEGKAERSGVIYKKTWEKCGGVKRIGEEHKKRVTEGGNRIHVKEWRV